jgi:exodeoxyribonuclease VII large subunit
VRAIAASKIPVITGIGHEVDESLCDLAADVVASTPSNAAQMLTRDRREIAANIQADIKRINNLLNTKIDELTGMNRTEIERVGREILHKIELLENDVSGQRKILEQLNPERVLERGYALVRGDMVTGSDIEIQTNTKIAKALIKEVKERKDG